MREILMALLILVALLLAVDFLAWRGLCRGLRLEAGSRARRGASAAFWGTAALAFALLALGLLFARRGDDTAGWAIVSTVTVLYLPKVVVAAAALVDWSVAGLRRLAARLSTADPGRRAELAARASGFRVFSLLGLGLAVGLYLHLMAGATLGRNSLAVHRVDVQLAGLPEDLEGLVVAHVSDLHLASLRDRPELIRKVVAAVEDARPDLVVCTGDVAPVAGLDEGPEILGRLRAPLGTFAVAGNHDFGAADSETAAWSSPEARDREVAALKEAYARRGARLLVNESARVGRGRAGLTLIGTGVFDEHHGYRDSDLEVASAGVDGVAILLTHNPELWSREAVGRRQIALTLAGHTHGGQVGLEAGPLRLSLAGLSLRHWGGLYREAGQFLYVNRGVGVYGPPFRAGIPAEVALIRLVRAAPPA
jgi:uncharacterized protein